MEEISLKFKKYVLYVFADSLSSKKKPWKYSDIIIGDGKINDFPFDEEKLILHKNDIIQILGFLGILKEKEIHYQDLKNIDKKVPWTELNFHAEIIFAMANALRMMEFKKSKLEWTKEDEKNPEIVCSKKK